MFAEYHGQPPVVLIDDPPSELDDSTRKFVFDYLERTPAQVFVTSINDVSINLHESAKVFHVERGIVQKVLY